MVEEAIPFNVIKAQEDQSVAGIAEREGISEEEWRAQNLPKDKLEFRWRYTNKTIQLYERRLRSLDAFTVGPAVRAWVRSRLEWVRDNKFYEMPDGVIVLAIDPEGDVNISQEPMSQPPLFTTAMFDKSEVPGSLVVVQDNKMYFSHEPKEAAETFVRDLAATLGFELTSEELPLDAAEIFAVSDEFGIIPLEGTQGQTVQKLTECFDKLWALKK